MKALVRLDAVAATHESNYNTVTLLHLPPGSHKSGLKSRDRDRRRLVSTCVENQPVAITTPSSRRRVDGVDDDAMIQHERAVKF